MDLALLEFKEVPSLYANGKLIFDGHDKNKALISMQTIWRSNTDRVTPNEYIVKYYDIETKETLTLTGSTV